MTIVELRQYTLHPGTRDGFIALFEREFVDSQEAEGMELIGTFRDADDPNRFVWLRGFPDMESRRRSLTAFYIGALWKTHRNAANACIVDSDNVLLLRPAWDGSGFAYRPRVSTAPTSMIVATICYFDAPVTDAAIDAFRKIEAHALAALVTEPGANTFPALPVREGENVFVEFARARPMAVPPELPVRKKEILRLLPTPRSRLHA